MGDSGDRRPPQRPSAPGQTVTIRSGGLATSSTAVRRWSHAGQTMHHIIDPATGAPARTPWRTVSVAAADCAQANIAATAALVRGERAPAWLAELGLPARLQPWHGAATTVGDWPAQRSADASRRRPRARRGIMSLPLAASGGSAYWYLTRSTGAVALLLLTLAVVLGVVDVRRLSTPRWPRFVVDSLHRNVSLLAMGFLGAAHPHVGARQLRPDLAARRVHPVRRLLPPVLAGPRRGRRSTCCSPSRSRACCASGSATASWRAVHWLTYASWPIALLHGLGTGSDVKATWLLGLSVACLLAVLARRARARDLRLAARTCALRGAALGGAGVVLAVPGAVAARRPARLGMAATLGHTRHRCSRTPPTPADPTRAQMSR